jgi:hypothetical protein
LHGYSCAFQAQRRYCRLRSLSIYIGFGRLRIYCTFIWE